MQGTIFSLELILKIFWALKKITPYLLPGLVAIVWLAIVGLSWSPHPYWPDADGYTLRVAQGQWVAHPPGYALFVIFGKAFHFLGMNPYLSIQFASLTLSILGILCSYFLFRMLLDTTASMLFSIATAFSWALLLNTQTGTSHSADLLTVSFLLYTALRLSKNKAGGEITWTSALWFGSALFLCAGFRLSTLLMMGPLLGVLAWHQRRNFRFWSAAILAAALITAWQIWVISEYGGYSVYSASVAGMNKDNAHSSLLISGPTQTAFLNILRALLWSGLTCLPFLLCVATARRIPSSSFEFTALVYGLAAFIGPFAGVSLYLCTHPGYVVSLIPGAALIAAAFTAHTDLKFARIPLFTGVAFTVFIFLIISPIAPMTKKWHAVANGILLQYSSISSREGIFYTTARWLRLADMDSEIPEHRKTDLIEEDVWKEKFRNLFPKISD